MHFGVKQHCAWCHVLVLVDLLDKGVNSFARLNSNVLILFQKVAVQSLEHGNVVLRGDQIAFENLQYHELLARGQCVFEQRDQQIPNYLLLKRIRLLRFGAAVVLRVFQVFEVLL